jgi:LruC domain-containing protein
MNDLVVDYQVNEISDANNQIKDVTFTAVIRATGAGMKNGFGVQLPLPANTVAEVSGQRHTTGTIRVRDNGVEDGQRLTTIIIADDVNYRLPIMANVSGENSHSSEDTLRVTVTFNQSLRKAELGFAPYNPFLIINQDRRREIHLMNQPPTDLVDRSLFGSANDHTNPSAGRFYTSEQGLNWALHTPISIDHTKERVDFTNGYKKFAAWARSGGFEYADWYVDNPDQRNPSVLYKKNR